MGDLNQEEKNLVIYELKRLNNKQDQMDKKIDTLIINVNDTQHRLLKNSEMIEHQQKVTKDHSDKLEYIEKDVDSIKKVHSGVKSILKPTKNKIIGILIVVSLVTGSLELGTDKPLFTRVVETLVK